MDPQEIERIIMLSTTRALQLINEDRMQRFASKLQVTKPEIIKAYDAATFKDLTNRLGLKPIRQNGASGKVYYSTKKVLEILSKWYHT